MITSLRKRSAAVVLVAVAMTLTACGSGAPSPASTAADVQIDPTAVLRFTSAAPVRNLDPAKQTSYGATGYLALIYDRLTMLDTSDNIIPGLATAWTFAKDGSYLELKLRQGVTFHDGTPFNAAAVKANIERDKTLADSTLKSDLTDITSVDAVDDSTVRLNLAKGKGVQLPSVFATNTGMMVSPKAIADPSADLANNPGNAGSGPYVVTSYTANEKVVLKQAPGYWDPKAGRLAGIELTFVQDGSTRLKGVQSGQTDLSNVSAPNDLAQAIQLGSRGEIKINQYRFRSITGVYLRANQGDLTKPEVRQAIAYAIDPSAISALFSGTCTPERQIYPDGFWAAIKNYQYPYAFNVDKAKDLVKTAGGAKVTVTFAAGSNVEQTANVVQSQLTAAGINAQLNPVPSNQNEPRFIAGDFELMVAASFIPKIDPADTVKTYLLDTYKLAPDRTSIEATASKAADPTLSQADRAPLYTQLWQTMLQQVWYIPICRQTFAVISNDKVVGIDNVPLSNLGIWDLRYVAMKK